MLKILLAFALLLIASSARDVTTRGRLCTAGAGGHMLVRGSTCYEFVDTEMTWVDARQQCRKNNGQLVGVPDVDVQLWLAANAAHLLPTRQGVWIGLNDRHTEGRYVWDSATGQGQVATYYNWKLGEPDDGRIGQDCVYMRRSYSWRWSDVECTLEPMLKYSFICEYVQLTPSIGPNMTATIAITETVETGSLTVPTTAIAGSSSAEGDNDVSKQDESNEDSSVDAADVDAGADAVAIAARGDADEDGVPGQSVMWPVVGVLVVVVGGALIFAFYFFSKRGGRFLRLQIPASSATASSAAGDKGKKFASDSADDIKSSLLHDTYLAGRVTADLRQQPGSTGRASPNIYVDIGFANRCKGGYDGSASSGDEPVYAPLVEPLP